ncbi:MAG: hypothetical protein RID23_17420 [Roseovarius sp.]
MPLLKPLFLLTALTLTACTPLQNCTYRATRDFRALEHNIRETEEALTRGYWIERRTVPRTIFTTCYRRDPATQKPIAFPCRDTVFRTETIRIPINRAVEARKLAEYRAALPAAQSRAATGVGQCKATYPEDA